jgi:hypothetical protein
MKKCLICGCIDEAGDAKTCPMCGEASWKPLESIAADVMQVVAAKAEEVSKPRRGRR